MPPHNVNNLGCAITHPNRRTAMLCVNAQERYARMALMTVFMRMTETIACQQALLDGYATARTVCVQDIDEAEGVRAVHRAFASGINYFDTSPFYGATRSEKVRV
eukprot:1139104-Pelagomonas_calceolata.AAC.4